MKTSDRVFWAWPLECPEVQDVRSGTAMQDRVIKARCRYDIEAALDHIWTAYHRRFPDAPCLGFSVVSWRFTGETAPDDPQVELLDDPRVEFHVPPGQYDGIAEMLTAGWKEAREGAPEDLATERAR